MSGLIELQELAVARPGSTAPVEVNSVTKRTRAAVRLAPVRMRFHFKSPARRPMTRRRKAKDSGWATSQKIFEM